MQNTEQIKVSVIIPNYCHANFLNQRIDSILNQTYQNFEIIILDDASPDNGASKAVIESYRNNPHVSNIVYNDKNSGSTFKQWETGIALAKGEFIWIAESDDFCETNILEKLTEQIKKHPSCSLVYCLSQQVNSKGSFMGKKIKSHGDHFLKGCDFIRRYMCCENPVYNASAAIFKKSSAQSISKDYISYKGAGDRLFWINIAEKGDVAIVNTPLNFFRQHEKKVTPQKTADGTNLTEDKKTFDYLIKHGYLISRIRRFLVKGYYLYLIQSTNFFSEDVRTKLLDIWNDGKQINKIQSTLGRLFVSIRYHNLNIYL